MLKFISLFSGLLLTSTSFSQTKDSSILVYGNKFSLIVKEPGGWVADITKAREYSANIIFYTQTSKLQEGAPIIQVLAFKKQDEETEKDLAADVKSYQKDFPDAKLQDFEAKHDEKEYKCYSKLVYVDKNFYQYIVYINPGKKYKNAVSVAMNISNRPSTNEEMNAFLNVISSLKMLGQ